MPSAIHHHQALHTVSQAVAASHPAWLNALPPWAQEPFFLSFAPCFVVLVLLMIRHRVKLHRRGEKFTAAKTKPSGYVGLFLIGGALVYFRDKYPVINLVMEWPDRFPYYRAHGFAMGLGFLAAGLAARMISALFAALFLRGGGARPGVSMGGFQPVAPPAYIARVWHRSTRTTWEDE